MEQHAQSRVIEILLVENNLGDVRLTKETLQESTLDNYLPVVGNGVDAMDLPNRQGSYRRTPRPNLILLHLNLPKKDGQETLAEIKNHMLLKRIPVLAFNASKAGDDIRQSYELHAKLLYLQTGALKHVRERNVARDSPS